MSLPKEMTVSTAMDAMTHAIEAMTSTMSNKICDGMALQAIRMINENLPLVAADGKNEKARLNMQLAATMAGWAFTVAQVGLAHGMAHTVGAMHHVPHGAACGIVLPKVMRYNVETSADKLAQVAHALNASTANMSDRDAALAAADAVEALMVKVGHPMRFRDVGVPRKASLSALSTPSQIRLSYSTGGPSTTRTTLSSFTQRLTSSVNSGQPE